MAGGAVEVLLVSLNCPATPKNPPPFIASRLLFVFAEMGIQKLILFSSGKLDRKRSHFGIILI
jgi:hypothetical protein